MTNFQLYIAGWLKMWPLLATFILLIVWTSIAERRDKLEKKMAKTNQRHNVKRKNY